MCRPLWFVNHSTPSWNPRSLIFPNIKKRSIQIQNGRKRWKLFNKSRTRSNRVLIRFPPSKKPLSNSHFSFPKITKSPTLIFSKHLIPSLAPWFNSVAQVLALANLSSSFVWARFMTRKSVPIWANCWVASPNESDRTLFLILFATKHSLWLVDPFRYGIE